MLRIVTLLTISIVLFCASIASAQNKPLYVSGFLGFNLNKERDYSNTAIPARGNLDFDNALSFGGALGLKLNSAIRIEAEVGYTKTDIQGLKTNAGNSSNVSGEIEAVTFMLNGYYDFDLDWPVTPFLGAGAGLGYFDTTINDNGANLTQNGSGDDLNLVYQLGGGLRYPISDDLNLSGAYRYVGSADIGFDQTEIDYSSHEIRIGLDYALPILWDE